MMRICLQDKVVRSIEKDVEGCNVLLSKGQGALEIAT